MTEVFLNVIRDRPDNLRTRAAVEACGDAESIGIFVNNSSCLGDDSRKEDFRGDRLSILQKGICNSSQLCISHGSSSPEIEGPTGSCTLFRPFTPDQYHGGVVQKLFGINGTANQREALIQPHSPYEFPMR